MSPPLSAEADCERIVPLLVFPVFLKLCAAAHWCVAEEAEVCREYFMI